VKPNINSVEVHPQLSNNRHLVDGALVGASSLYAHLLATCKQLGDLPLGSTNNNNNTS
jgi:hypothetical protein